MEIKLALRLFELYERRESFVSRPAMRTWSMPTPIFERLYDPLGRREIVVVMKDLSKELEPAISRRDLFAWGAGIATVATMPIRASAVDAGLTKVWVRYVTGGHPYRPSFAAMFLDPMFLEIEVGSYDHPYNMMITPPPPQAGRGGGGGGGFGAGFNGPPVFASDNPPDLPWIPSTTIQAGVRSLLPGGAPVFSVLLLNDQIEWPDDTRANIQKAVEAGKGIVVIHNALGDNQTWPWWYQEVTGGLLALGWPV